MALQHQGQEWVRENEPEMLAGFFSTFGDATRIRILNALLKGEICVGDLANELDMTQSAISHQLKVLKASRLVKSRRDGKQIYEGTPHEHTYVHDEEQMNMLLMGYAML